MDKKQKILTMPHRDHQIALKKAILIFIVIGIGWNRPVFAFVGETHRAITKEAVGRSVLSGNYLDEQLGFTDKLTTELELLGQFQNNINIRVSQERDFVWAKTKISIREWLMDGSMLEDVPNPRARHHFHDPIRNTGMDNSERPEWLLNLIKSGSKKRYPDYWEFDATGGSSFDRAIHNTGIWETEYLNYYYWGYARSLFYEALRTQSKTEREKTFGSFFIIMGHICHLLEDQGVPAHTRNDFIWGHMVGGYYDEDTPLKDGGNPFEIWVETQVKNDNNEIPPIYLSRLMDSPPVFSKLEHYWDTGICELSGAAQWQGDSPGWPTSGFGNRPPEKSWGLAECSNYQFLSYSTMFKNSGLQSFPHPAKEHTRVDWYFVGDKKQYYRIGYEVPHLARSTFTTYIADLAGIPLSLIPDTPEDRKVYEDYAKRTIPRTIDYTTGLINYFFRGRLSVVPNCITPDCDPIELYITNQSVNTNVNQTLKGGSFELYWDDASGNRSLVSDFTIDGGWGPSSTLAYGSTITGAFTHPTGAEKYILVYKGQINANPVEPDADDPNAIAVDTFAPPVPPPYIANITPEMGCPGSVLLVEGSGFSATPADNTVSFEDVNGIEPDVYATVLEVDSNGTWMTVELPYFDAEDVDYYWVNTTVTVDSNTSVPYPFQLTNYIWCTITLWDAGENIDDEFDLYINDEYWLTSYQAPPEDPTITEVGFWYEDIYDFVDVYLYESYGISGGTLGIIIMPYVQRVTAYRWNSAAGIQESLYDNQCSGLFADYFGSDLLTEPDDGIELDVYTSLTYTGMEQSQSTNQTIGIVEESTANDSTSSIREARGKPGFVDAVQRTYEPVKVHKRSRKRMGSSSRTRRWYDKY